VTALKTSTASLTTELKKQLKAAGVSDAEIAKMEVSSFKAEKKASGTTGTTGTTGAAATGAPTAGATQTGVSFFAAVAAVTLASSIF